MIEDAARRLTERRNPRTQAIDQASPAELVALIGAEDAGVPAAVAREAVAITRALELVEAAFRAGGRLLYVGAGTSGRLGVLDAVECPPTFGTPPALVVGIIAGGARALAGAVEGAEDDVQAGTTVMDEHQVAPADVVVGIAASGVTPFVRAALGRARELGARTVLLACADLPPQVAEPCDATIVVRTGPEVVTGSTRMKAGTATKLVLNTLTTGALIRLGKTYGNLMVDLRATSAKLVDRGQRIVMEVTGVTRDQARAAIAAAGGSVRTAIVMVKTGTSQEEAERLLVRHDHHLRPILGDPPPPPYPLPRAAWMAEPSSVGIGLMSGTSLDGMDAALVRLDGPHQVELLAFAVRPYRPEERTRLEAAVESLTARDLALLHADLGHWAVEAVEAVLRQAGRPAGNRLDFIAFAGHTVWHEPPRVTWQLGEPAALAERFRVPVVSTLRARDLAAGGQGAPLVPIADVHLFGAEHPRVLLNLGGMANLTYVARRGVVAGAFAFDTGPGVAVMDAVARLVEPGCPFDRDGRLARAGRADEAVLAELLSDPFFALPPPRSTGREKFGAGCARDLHRRVPGPDGVATAMELTARSVALALERWVPPGCELVASGGGVHHPGLMAALEARLASRHPVHRFSRLFFDGDAKEAVAFALLGYLTLHGRPGNLPAATGARGPRVLGVISPA